MDEDKLPENIVSITALSINRNKRKNCQCYEILIPPFGKTPKFEIDPVNREIICGYCGVIVDPFDVLEIMSRRWEYIQHELTRQYEQAKTIQDYKPWLKAIKNIESQCRSGKYIPSCPHCGKGMLLEELNHWTSKEMELQRRKFIGGD